MLPYRKLVWLLTCSCSVLYLAACTGSSANSSHCTVIHHPEPTLTVERGSFTDAGCVLDKDNSQAVCAKAPPLTQLGCQTIRFDDLLGGLAPHDPIATCLQSAHQPETFPKYVIFHDGRYSLLSTQEEFRARYTPIESEDEALSYALAVTGYHVFYYPVDSCDHLYTVANALVAEIKETHIERLANGYRVYLFDPSYGGLTSIVLDVARDGTITRHSIQRLATPM